MFTIYEPKAEFLHEFDNENDNTIQFHHMSMYTVIAQHVTDRCVAFRCRTSIPINFVNLNVRSNLDTIRMSYCILTNRMISKFAKYIRLHDLYGWLSDKNRLNSSVKI